VGLGIYLYRKTTEKWGGLLSAVSGSAFCGSLLKKLAFKLSACRRGPGSTACRCRRHHPQSAGESSPDLRESQSEFIIDPFTHHGLKLAENVLEFNTD
jgi:hypothetical protein